MWVRQFERQNVKMIHPHDVVRDVKKLHHFLKMLQFPDVTQTSVPKNN